MFYKGGLSESRIKIGNTSFLNSFILFKKDIS